MCMRMNVCVCVCTFYVLHTTKNSKGNIQQFLFEAGTSRHFKAIIYIYKEYSMIIYDSGLIYAVGRLLSFRRKKNV